MKKKSPTYSQKAEAEKPVSQNLPAYVRSNVAAIGARVLARQPDLHHALPERLPHPLHDLLRVVRAQLTARMLRLAVSALVQAARVHGDDLDKRVAAHLWQVEPGAALLPTVLLLLAHQAHAVALQRLLDNLYYPVDLLHAYHAQAL